MNGDAAMLDIRDRIEAVRKRATPSGYRAFLLALRRQVDKETEAQKARDSQLEDRLNLTIPFDADNPQRTAVAG